jgi:hypothetical protein
LPAAGNVGLAIFLRGAARCRAGENGFGNLAMTLLLCWRGWHWPKRRAAGRIKRPRRARQLRTTPQPIASAVLHGPAGAPPDQPVRDDCSRAAAERRREYGAQYPASDANAATVPKCRRPSARRSAHAETAATAAAAYRRCSACRTRPRSRLPQLVVRPRWRVQLPGAGQAAPSRAAVSTDCPAKPAATPDRAADVDARDL